MLDLGGAGAGGPPGGIWGLLILLTKQNAIPGAGNMSSDKFKLEISQQPEQLKRSRDEEEVGWEGGGGAGRGTLAAWDPIWEKRCRLLPACGGCAAASHAAFVLTGGPGCAAISRCLTGNGACPGSAEELHLPSPGPQSPCSSSCPMATATSPSPCPYPALTSCPSPCPSPCPQACSRLVARRGKRQLQLTGTQDGKSLFTPHQDAGGNQPEPAGFLQEQWSFLRGRARCWPGARCPRARRWAALLVRHQGTVIPLPELCTGAGAGGCTGAEPMSPVPGSWARPCTPSTQHMAVRGFG